MHKRQKLRAAVVDAINATTALAGRTFSTRLRTTEVAEMPVALVYFTRETSGHRDLKMTLERVSRCIVELKAVAPSEADLADVLDDLAEIVEGALYEDPELGGLALALELVETNIVLDGTGNRKDGAALLGFDIRYVTRRP